mmetsp:Transcript_49926/g.100500  ORF Transcript_49926/g.100500 Transcript_49926/m.100500 type:complete len:216 (-) Transcript_49926:549-1196(-)
MHLSASPPSLKSMGAADPNHHRGGSHTHKLPGARCPPPKENRLIGQDVRRQPPPPQSPPSVGRGLSHMRLWPGAPAWRMPLRICPATSATAPALWGRKTVWALVFAAMSRSVSKYCVIRSSSETFSVDRVSCVPWVMESRRPSMIARRCRAIPSPWSCAASAEASAAFTTLIFSASAAMMEASRRRFCLLISFMECMTSALGVSSVTRDLWMAKP